jgi:glycerol kinase
VTGGTAPVAFAGTPISGVAGDQQSALFGQACFEIGMAKATYGTGSFVLANVGDACPPPSEGLVTSLAWDLGGHGPGPTYALEGSTFVSGAAIQWLRDKLCVIERAEDLGPLAASVADSGGVSVVPAFTGLGSPWWDPTARGTILGLTRGAGRAQLARAVVESIAFSVRAMVDAMAEATTAPSVLRVDGGAAAMDLLLQLQADQLDAPVARPSSVESTALGAAMLAGLAEGVWGSLDELASLWRLEVEFTPQADREPADAAYATWLRAVERSKRWV